VHLASARAIDQSHAARQRAQRKHEEDRYEQWQSEVHDYAGHVSFQDSCAPIQDLPAFFLLATEEMLSKVDQVAPPEFEFSVRQH
jgi:hypothetical protein